MLLFLIILLIVAGVVHGRIYQSEVENEHRPAGQFRQIDGLAIHYLDLNPSATGAPLVLIHGVSSNLLDMKLALGDALAADRRVILIDRPGYGHSAREPGKTGMARQAAIIERLLGEIGAIDPIIIAHSYGGALALRHALDFPDRARGLILLAPVSHRWPGGVDWHNHAGVMPVVGPIFRHAVVPLYGRLAGRKAVRNAFWPQPQPADYFDRAGMAMIFRPGAFLATAEDLVELYDQITLMEPHYGALSMPVRMLAGTHDTTVLSTIHCLGLERKTREARLAFVTDTGHTVHHNCLERVQGVIDKLDAPSSR